MKYIVLETEDGRRLPIIFPEQLTHCFVAGAMQLVVDTLDPKKDLRPRQLDRMLQDGDAKPTSAGFVQIQMCAVSGRSESLNDLASNPADEARMILGEAIQFGGDDFALALLEKFKEMQGGQAA